VDQCRNTNEHVYDHSIDMVVDWRDSEGYADVARFKRDMQVTAKKTTFFKNCF
jgi:hypothetical protein